MEHFIRYFTNFIVFFILIYIYFEIDMETYKIPIIVIILTLFLTELQEINKNLKPPRNRHNSR